jgi:hypothetical protein
MSKDQFLQHPPLQGKFCAKRVVLPFLRNVAYGSVLS